MIFKLTLYMISNTQQESKLDCISSEFENYVVNLISIFNTILLNMSYLIYAYRSMMISVHA
jgi:hypothetical protein